MRDYALATRPAGRAARLLGLLAALALALSASAAPTWTVTKTADTNDGVCDSDCSLREAIAAAASGDTIVFHSGLSGSTIALGSVVILTKNVTIDGSTLAASIILDGRNANRVFYVNSGVTATLNRLTISRGNAGSGLHGGGLINYGVLTVTDCFFSANTAYYGGGLFNEGVGTMTVANCVFSGNTTVAGGGGLRNNGGMTVTNSTFSGNSGGTGWGGGILTTWGRGLTVSNSTFSGNTTGNCGGGIDQEASAMTVIDSTFSNNTAAAAGGGICNHYGNMTVRNSTFSGNSARSAGGIFNNAGTMTVGNSTFSGNNAAGSDSEGAGGGLANAGQGTLNNCTFSGNRARVGGGLWNGTYGGRVLNFANNIIANSVAGGDCYDTGTILTNLNNLVADGSCSTNGVNFKTGDPLLGALADNGGPTQTFALLTGSPAINAGDNTTCAAAPVSGEDQRGEDRNDSQCDIGAFELKNQPPSVEARGPYSVDEGGTVQVEATGSDPEGEALTYAWDLDDDGVFETPGQSASFAAGSRDGPGSQAIAVQATDPGGLSASAETMVEVANVAPTATLSAPAELDEGDAFVVELTDVQDPSAADMAAGFTFAFDCGAGYGPSGEAAERSCSAVDNPGYAVGGQVADKDGGVRAYTARVSVRNAAPSLGPISAPGGPVLVKTPVTASADFTDPGVLDTHTATWEWGDGTTTAGAVTETGGSGTVSGAHEYATAGLYWLKLTVTDKDGASVEGTTGPVAVYDPTGGFVTGGGWITSPAGAYAPDLATGGKLTLSLVAKYGKGATTPKGNLEAVLHPVGMKFKATTLEWLVVTGPTAELAGVGTINGQGSYRFALGVVDGRPDTVRLRIWAADGAGETLYDTGTAQPLGGGNIDVK